LTCMQNVGALRMLGECSTRCHLKMWSLEARWYWDMWNMGKGRRRWNYWRIQQHGVQPNSVTFVGVPNACASLIALEEGRCVHHHITQSGLEMNPYFGTGCSLGLTYHNGSLL
jgi:hypothetical protein